jgi:adhesin HecA-like repeat protein
LNIDMFFVSVYLLALRVVVAVLVWLANQLIDWEDIMASGLGWIKTRFIRAGAVTADKLASGAAPTSLKQAIVTGGAAGALTLTGIATDDTLVGVILLVGAGTDVTDATDLTSEFSITAADTIDNTAGTATTGGKLLVTYVDASA